MVIILSGSECTLKSTLAKSLQERFSGRNFEIVRGSSFEIAKRSNKELFEFHLGICQDICSGRNIILDRFYLDNLVYASLYKGYSILSPEQVRVVENYIDTTNYALIYCYDTPENIFRRLSVRGDEYIKTRAELDAIDKRYREVLMKEISLVTYHFDCSFSKLSDLFEYVEERIDSSV